MAALAFISLWQTRPFRAFRARLTDGRAVVVAQAQQVAASPDLRHFVVVSDGGPVAFTPEQVAACDVVEGTPAVAVPATAGEDNPYGLDDAAVARLRAAGVDPASMAMPRPDAGALVVMTVFTDDQVRLTQCALKDRDGRTLLTTMMTRWDLHGVETFENGRRLHLIHADDPLLQRCVFVWPPARASFESFAEATTPGEVQRQLQAMDEAAKARPGVLTPPKGYIESLKPPVTSTPPSQPRYWKGEEAWDEEPRPNDGPPASAFRLETVAEEFRPHQFADQVRLVRAGSGAPVFDLTDCGWYGEGALGSGVWHLKVHRAGEEGTNLALSVWPGSGQAAAKPLSGVYPSWFVERVLRNYALYQEWKVLSLAIRDGPRPATQPEAVMAWADGYVVELWPGASEVATPFLQPRVLCPRQRPLLDLRGSAWGAYVKRVADREHTIDLRLINRDGPDRGRFEMVSTRLHVDVIGRRVTSPDLPGSTALGVLHSHAHACRTCGMLRSWLGDSMALGANVPRV